MIIKFTPCKTRAMNAHNVYGKKILLLRKMNARLFIMRAFIFRCDFFKSTVLLLAYHIALNPLHFTKNYIEQYRRNWRKHMEQTFRAKSLYRFVERLKQRQSYYICCKHQIVWLIEYDKFGSVLANEINVANSLIRFI